MNGCEMLWGDDKAAFMLKMLTLAGADCACKDGGRCVLVDDAQKILQSSAAIRPTLPTAG